jgi:hypothetical protein
MTQEVAMGGRAITGGHLCIDLGSIEMSGHEQQELMGIVQHAVVTFLVKVSTHAKVVTISMSENNGNVAGTKLVADIPDASGGS